MFISHKHVQPWNIALLSRSSNHKNSKSCPSLYPLAPMLLVRESSIVFCLRRSRMQIWLTITFAFNRGSSPREVVNTESAIPLRPSSLTLVQFCCTRIQRIITHAYCTISGVRPFSCPEGIFEFLKGNPEENIFKVCQRINKELRDWSNWFGILEF